MTLSDCKYLDITMVQMGAHVPGGTGVTMGLDDQVVMFVVSQYINYNIMCA